MRLAIHTEYIIDRYIMRRKGLCTRFYDQYKLVIAVADAVAGDEIAKIRSGICPFCGKRFRRSGIAKHLKSTVWKTLKIRPYGSEWFWVQEIYPKNPCVYKYAKLVEYIANAYIKFKSAVRKTSPNRIHLEVNGKVYRFRNIGEVVQFIRKDPKVVYKVIEGARCA